MQAVLPTLPTVDDPAVPGAWAWAGYPPLSRRRALGGLLLLLGAVLLAYVPAMQGDFIWDDDQYVLENKTLESLDGLRRIWIEPRSIPQWYPLVHTTFWIERQIWGLDPTGFHVVNVVLHALGAILAWAVLRRLHLPGAFLAAAIFALHPVHVESVAWITERKNVLSGVFYLWALLAYLRFNPIAETEGSVESQAGRRWLWYGLSLLLFLGALLSKSVTATLPAVIVLLIWWKRGRVSWRDGLALLPFFAMGVALGLHTAWLEKHHVGAWGPDFDFSIFDRCLIAGRALWFYAGKLAWPSQLTFIYPRWVIDDGVWWQYLFPVSALAVMVSLFLLRKRIGRGPVVAVCCFAGTLFPALGFLNVFPMIYSFVADHFQYLASLALIALAAAGGARLMHKASPRARRGGVIAAALLLVVLGSLSWAQARIYSNLETLYADTIRKNPGCWMAMNNLGNYLAAHGRAEEAVDKFRSAIAVKGDYAGGYFNLGNALARLGRLEEAIAHYQKALQLAPKDGKTHNHLGKALLDVGRDEEAMRHLRLGVQYSGGLKRAPAHYNLGVALYKRGEHDEALGHLISAATLDPRDADMHHSLGLVYEALRRPEEAIKAHRDALHVAPAHVGAHVQLGVLLARQRDFEQARQHLEKALHVHPGNVGAHSNLAMLLMQQQRLDGAIRHFQAVLEIAPDHQGSLRALAWLRATHPVAALRDGPEALQLAQRAVELAAYRDATLLDTLAAALAESGRHAEAVEVARQAANLALASGKPRHAEAIRHRIALYSTGQAFYQSLDATRRER